MHLDVFRRNTLPAVYSVVLSSHCSKVTHTFVGRSGHVLVEHLAGQADGTPQRGGHQDTSSSCHDP